MHFLALTALLTLVTASAIPIPHTNGLTVHPSIDSNPPNTQSPAATFSLDICRGYRFLDCGRITIDSDICYDVQTNSADGLSSLKFYGGNINYCLIFKGNACTGGQATVTFDEPDFRGILYDNGGWDNNVHSMKCV
ncbi:hypothetical protein EJ08DRAFT_700892 [Tothia fuscella]|uniref:Uncharacterized protein n=1 Tax=Tothia fuscella TaxID=1048955 RepID=A0A9P4NK02_9PEZI|nr:hypothetical protein EJ08DRAFT_700892 [Tothia fuscella]